MPDLFNSLTVVWEKAYVTKHKNIYKIYFSCPFRKAKQTVLQRKNCQAVSTSNPTGFLKLENLNFRELRDIMQCEVKVILYLSGPNIATSVTTFTISSQRIKAFHWQQNSSPSGKVDWKDLRDYHFVFVSQFFCPHIPNTLHLDATFFFFNFLKSIHKYMQILF